MELARYVETLRDQLVVAAELGGPESRAAVERLAPGLEAAMRLVLLEALSAAADEITRELAPGAVEVRLRGSDPDFVVALPAYETGDVATSGSAASPTVIAAGDEEGGTSRLNLRLPEGLKAKIEEAARREGLSLNAWLVRAAAVAAEGTHAQMPRRRPGGSQRFTGWVH
jgi:HicB-like protein involved in pilus formation